MNVLFLHANQPDYLAESLFHGLREVLGKKCVDFPRYDSMYSPLTIAMRSKLRGYGFTIYGLLDEVESLKEERFFWKSEFILPKYDLVVVADIWNLAWLAYDLSSVIDPKKIVVLDGYDIPAFFPYANMKYWLKKPPFSLLLLPTLNQYKYFKRELYGGLYTYGLSKYVPRQFLDSWKAIPKNSIPISFSIPQEKVWYGKVSQKIKDFQTHIVDREVASFVSNASEQYAFTSEADYYQDLRESRFGITMKRAGWDCMRHYELAAQGCVLCFRDLDLKPELCAPHGLNSSNSIIYHSYNELNEKIVALRPDRYVELQKNTYDWINRNTTIERAKQFLEACSQI